MSFSELLFLGVLGLVVFGPKKLASIAPEIGKTLNRLKTASSEFRSQIEKDVSESTTVQNAQQTRVDGASIPY
jgi:Sec-independent protein translocase protein TatA